MKYKQYSKKLDTFARSHGEEKVIDFLRHLGYEVDFYPKKTASVDLIAKKKGKELLVEWEIKFVWKVSGKWIDRFPTVDVPHRKMKSEADIFIQINANADTLNMTEMTNLLEAKVYHKNTYTKYTNQRTINEKFFAVELDKFRWFTFQNNQWIEINHDGSCKE